MTAPMSYTGFSVVVNPTALTDAAAKISGTDPKNIGGWIGEILQSLQRIGETLTNLKVGWAGQTADEAEAFGTKWQLAAQQLFGGTGDAADGSLVRVAVAIAAAGNNYNHAEDGISQMLSQLIQGMQPGPASSDDSGFPAYIPPPAEETTLPWQGAVSETF